MERYNRILFCACFWFASCAGGTSSTTSNEQQATTQQAAPIGQKSFKGHWVSARANYDVIDIGAEGSLTIVSRHSEGNEIFKAPGVSKNDNILVINTGGGDVPLTLSDDGSKFYFGGGEFIKK